MRSIQNTSSRTYRQLMGNGLTYIVPRFQRDYSWTVDQWDDLWQDLQEVMDTNEEHYMGYLVFQTSDDKQYIVVDGQQRFTTLTLIVLTVMKVLKDLIGADVEVENNTKRMELIQNTYIGVYDPVSLTVSNKLQLNRNGNDYYRDYLIMLDYLPVRNRNHSEKAMRKCFQWYHKKVKEQYQTGAALAGFIDRFVDKLYFTVLEVNSSINAYKVFETINARGVQLSSADLLKNYFFSEVDKSKEPRTPERIDTMERLWSGVITELHDEKIENYLRYYWNSRYKTTRKNQLFKTIKGEINTAESAFNLVRGMNNEAEVYMALKQPTSNFWSDQDNQAYQEAVKDLKTLQLFGVKQTYSLLLAGYRHLDPRRFKKLVKMCVVIAFRYSVIGKLNANDIETAYNNIALAMKKKAVIPYSLFHPVYVPKEQFVQRFSTAEFGASNKKIPRYIFTVLEHHQSGQELQYDGSSYTLEHILPQKARGEEWSGVASDDFDRMTHRLGNLTLLEKSKNEGIGNAGYEQKKAIFKTSNCQLTKSIPEHYEVWSVDTIATRQEHLAALAVQIWSIQELEP